MIDPRKKFVGKVNLIYTSTEVINFKKTLLLS